MDNKERAREYLIKSKVYRLLGLVFAGVGVVLFCYMVFQKSEGGDVYALLRDPFMIVTLIVPFVPAIVLSYMAQRFEKKVQDFVKEK